MTDMRALRSVFASRSPRGDTIANVELTAVLWREGSDWVSQCLELDVASSGQSPEEAVEQLIDAVCAYLNTLEELGEREAVFAKKGIRLRPVAPSGNFHPSVPRELLHREGAQIRQLNVAVPKQEPALV